LLASSLAALAEHTIPLGLDSYIPAPEGNPLRAEVIALGKKMFRDPALSRDRTVSCATCHRPDYAFTDPRPLAIGVRDQKGSRRSPAIFNRAWGRAFFWDGRASTLEEQVVQPIANPLEMDLAPEEAARRVGLTRDQLARALASYVRTILAGGSPYDRYVAGDRGALSAESQAGLKIFRGKGNCIACHVGPNLTDERFHNTGVSWAGDSFRDKGRAEVTSNGEDLGAFKTPSLRHVAERPPYMHDGSLGTLDEVIEFYDKGGIRNPNLDVEMRPLRLTPEEKRSLAAFLMSLTGTIVD
jgi:cytochrome c peroxidase